jgi:hypothetical protein
MGMISPMPGAPGVGMRAAMFGSGAPNRHATYESGKTRPPVLKVKRKSAPDCV